MAEQKPWSVRWAEERLLGQGGQGTTELVRSRKDDSLLAVLKKLKERKSSKARRRMYREIANLRIVHNAGGKVPEVYDDNAHELDSPGSPFYFVMEYIDGSTLFNFVTDRGPLSLDVAVQITLGLCETIRLAHENNVLHRDIKPKNIVLRNSDHRSAVIIDYGLSYSELDSTDATSVGESIGNRFLALPEMNVTGGNRRDTRSDLTLLCGILHYCATGHEPRRLDDGNGKPPHRREDAVITENRPDDPQAKRIAVLLDRGFAMELDNRFQTTDELIDRLKAAIADSTTAVRETLEERVARLRPILHQQDRKTQLKEIEKKCVPIIQALANRRTYYRTKIEPFMVDLLPVQPSTPDLPNGIEGVGIPRGISVSWKTHELYTGFVYQIGAQGQQATLLISNGEIHGNPSQIPGVEGSWEVSEWFGFQADLDVGPAIECFDQAIGDAIDRLLAEKGIEP